MQRPRRRASGAERQQLQRGIVISAIALIGWLWLLSQGPAAAVLGLLIFWAVRPWGRAARWLFTAR